MSVHSFIEIFVRDKYMNKKSSNNQIITAVEENLFAYIRFFANHKKNLYHEDDAVLTFISETDIPSMQSNSIYKIAINKETNIDEQIKTLIRPFKDKKKPLFLTTGPSSKPENLKEHLEKNGIHHVQTQRGMALDLETYDEKFELPNNLVLKKVEDETDLKNWLKIYTIGFDYSSSLGDFIYNQYGDKLINKKDDMTHYIAYLNGKPVSTSTLFITDNIAGLYNIITIPEGRNNGLGKIMTKVPLEEGKKQGCKIAILQATELGVPLYSKLGFNEVCTFDLFMKLHGKSSITFPGAYISKKITNSIRSLVKSV